MSADASNKSAETQSADDSNRNKEESKPESNLNDESNDNSKAAANADSNNKEQSDEKKKSDDDKNIHVPKDKNLKIDYVSVKNSFVHNDVVFYDIHVKTAQHYWHVTKRYSQFEDLHSQLLQISKEKLPLLPAKHYKWFTDHTKPAFIEKRRALLDNYVKKLIRAKGVNSSQCVVNFFHNDKQAEEVIEKRRIEQEQLRASLAQNDEAPDEEQAEGAAAQNNEANEEEQKVNGHIKERRLSDDWEFPEDQEVTNVVIQSTRKMTDHVLYQICVSNSHKRASFRAWTVLKRFTQFYEMDSKLRTSLQTQNPDLLPKLPPAPSRKLKLVHDHMDDDFIEERRVLLENYLSKLLRFPEVVRNEDFLDFLGVDM